jgi:hypothetical protein
MNGRVRSGAPGLFPMLHMHRPDLLPHRPPPTICDARALAGLEGQEPFVVHLVVTVTSARAHSMLSASPWDPKVLREVRSEKVEIRTCDT